MRNFRTAIIGLAAVAIVGTQALAADVSLAPGKPAGTKEAQRRARSPNLLLIGGAAAVAVVAVVVAALVTSAQGAIRMGPGNWPAVLAIWLFTRSSRSR